MVQIDMDMPKCCADCDMETYEENYNGDPTFHYCPMVYKGYTDEIRDRGRLNDCPVNEVKHGKWIPCTKTGMIASELVLAQGGKWYGFKCSECRFIYKGNALTESIYCQCCGARMGG